MLLLLQDTCLYFLRILTLSSFSGHLSPLLFSDQSTPSSHYCFFDSWLLHFMTLELWQCGGGRGPMGKAAISKAGRRCSTRWCLRAPNCDGHSSTRSILSVSSSSSSLSPSQQWSSPCTRFLHSLPLPQQACSLHHHHLPASSLQLVFIVHFVSSFLSEIVFYSSRFCNKIKIFPEVGPWLRDVVKNIQRLMRVENFSWCHGKIFSLKFFRANQTPPQRLQNLESVPIRCLSVMNAKSSFSSLRTRCSPPPARRWTNGRETFFAIFYQTTSCRQRKHGTWVINYPGDPYCSHSINYSGITVPRGLYKLPRCLTVPR